MPGASQPRALEKTAEQIRAGGGECLTIAADLAKPEEREAIIEGALAHFGKVDILVNNAAWAHFGPTHRFQPHHIRLAFEMNSFAPLALAQAVIPAMIEQGSGWILNISSGTSAHPGPAPFNDDERYTRFHRENSPTLYGATKSASERLSTGLAAELSPFGIAVNTLAPVEAVASEGAVTLMDLDGGTKVEPVEAMAEAALALCSRPAAQLSGRNAVSLPLLDELGLPIRSLTGTPPAREGCRLRDPPALAEAMKQTCNRAGSPRYLYQQACRQRLCTWQNAGVWMALNQVLLAKRDPRSGTKKTIQHLFGGIIDIIAPVWRGKQHGALRKPACHH